MQGLEPQLADDQHVPIVEPDVGERRWAQAVHDHRRAERLAQLAAPREVVGMGVGVDHIADMQAQLSDLLAELPDGIHTPIGERGSRLSGGQRQRIAIARVMLKNAPILLLDEATSALDSEVEYAITESLNSMMTGKTVIAIAHRLSTIAALDRLVVMDKGRIIEQGSHEELLAKNGVYAGLWDRQSGGFLGEDE